jgi:ribosomal protein S18 acetylase RimI-like enzyme
LLKLVQAETPKQIATIRELMLKYAHWLEFDLCFQGFEEELRALPGKYAPPAGRLFLALWDDKVAGMGALRPLSQPGVCEMKRLYVRPEFRGHSLGKLIAQELIRSARECGYSHMRLDTVAGKMDSAIALYRRLGFYEVAPYYDSPMERTLYMQLDLHRSAGDGDHTASSAADTKAKI